MKLPWHDKKFVFLALSVIIVVILEVLSLLNMDIPMPYAPIVFAAFILGIGYSVLWGGVKALISLNFSSINLLMLIAVIAAFYLGEYPEAAVVTVLYVLGETMEDIGLDNSQSALDSLIEKSPKVAYIKGSETPTPIEEVNIGDVVIIKPYDIIPIDGIVQEGNTTVDESSITGEPLTKDKTLGDNVFAGTINKSGYIEIKVSKTVKDSTLSKIIELCYKSQENKSERQRFVEKFASVYTPAMLVISLLLFSIPVLFMGVPVNEALKPAIVLLVIACPCAFVISTPVAVYAALGNASSHGVLIKGGVYLEALAEIKTICLDKTRTITYGKPIVSDLFPFGISKEELLGCAAGTEIFSEHPLAQSIVELSKKEGLNPHASENYKTIIGKGAQSKCTICNHNVQIGNTLFVTENNELPKEAESIVKNLHNEGKTAVLVSFDSKLAGIIGISDEIKPDSVHALKKLHELNIKTIMLTGDSQRAGEHIAEEVGISKVYGDLLPEGKSDIISQLLEEDTHVAMVGDGVNDAPALAKASVGIAMGAAGSDIAIETANVALMNDKISLIPYAIELGKKATSTIKFNSIFAIATKFLVILLAILGYANLVLAIMADVGVTILVILISLRLMNTPKPS